MHRRLLTCLWVLVFGLLAACAAPPEQGVDEDRHGAPPLAAERQRITMVGPLMQQARLFAGDMEILLWLPPRMDDRGTIWVTLEPFVHGLSGTMSWDAGTRAATLRFEGRELVLEEGRQEGRLDGTVHTLPAAPHVVDPNYLVVPLDPLLELYRATARAGVHGDLHLAVEHELPQRSAELELAIVAEDGAPLSVGLVAVEHGAAHTGHFVRGGLFEDGAFSTTLPATGLVGIHVYAEGHVVHAEEVRLSAAEPTRLHVVMAALAPADPVPALADLHVRRATMGDEPGLVMEVTVTDPAERLSEQVLAIDPSSGEVLQLMPPRPVVEPDALSRPSYPNGRYTFEYVAPPGQEPGDTLYFVAANTNGAPSNILLWQREGGG